MARRAALVALLGLLVALLVGCGGDDEPSTSSPETPTESAEVAGPTGLEEYLLQDGDIPGLVPIDSPVTNESDPFDLPPGGAEVLQRSGYVSTTFQPAEGEEAAGVSSVLLFDSEQGARAWMAYETLESVLRFQIPEGDFDRFRVRDVPGARGWTGPDLHGNAIGNVYWTQGRCMLLVAIETEGPKVELLSTGAQSIYERTGGTCPE
jgi:hypothetical protein